MSAAYSGSGLRGRRQEILAGWKKDIAEMAKCPNVNVKLGGVGMTSFGFDFHERDVPPSSEELAAAWRQYIEPCIEAFGVNQCMFESNFPPDKQSCGYTELWNAFKRITSGASAAETALQRHRGPRIPADSALIR
jgi:predicted TIM-barrel fold metal-dependent hydrolase